MFTNTHHHFQGQKVKGQVTWSIVLRRKTCHILTRVWRLSRTSGRRAACAAGRLNGTYSLIGPGSAGLAQGCRCTFPLQAWMGAYRGGSPPTACFHCNIINQLRQWTARCSIYTKEQRTCHTANVRLWHRPSSFCLRVSVCVNRTTRKIETHWRCSIILWCKQTAPTIRMLMDSCTRNSVIADKPRDVPRSPN